MSMKYIDADKLIAEIRQYVASKVKDLKPLDGPFDNSEDAGAFTAYSCVSEFLDTLEAGQFSLPEGLDETAIDRIRHILLPEQQLDGLEWDLANVICAGALYKLAGKEEQYTNLLKGFAQKIKLDILEAEEKELPKGLENAIQDWTKRVKDGIKNPQYQIEDVVRDCVKAGALCKVKRIPLLPQGLDEAAEKYRRDSCNKAMLPNIDGPMPEYGGSVKDAFKAGAEWMAGHGFTCKGKIVDEMAYDDLQLLELIPNNIFSPKEEVIVQIRKSESSKKDWHEENESHGAFALTQDEIEFYYKK